ncbi:helicase-related protein [uncultured Methanobrevibacter sp.]|uniref:helicase-related protein n=1 Tax=uncultured Methanobrevibacter sp. TaxID=253161 RepID=UPI0026394780|nr:helicase-related protein [uncultured Methanobrevibacter sp.]
MPEFKTLNNQLGETVYKELKKHVKKGSKVSTISAYFTMYAYNALKKELDNIDEMRFIFTTPSFSKNKDIEAMEYEIINNNIFGNEFELKLRNEMTQSAVAKDCAKWLKDKVKIKSFIQSNAAQPRMIHVNNKSNEDIVINGSVDFTTDGLGITGSNRADFNNFMAGEEFTDPQLLSFDNLWNNEMLLKDVKDKVLKQMEVMYEENSGEFIYFKSLYHIFHDYLDELNEDNIVKKGNKLKETKIWNTLYQFQQDAVIGAIDKIEKYNGCILADSVGLGKTFTALAIIQYYELRNDRVLVLVPKKLRENWTIYTLNDKRNIFAEDRFRYDVLNHTDLSRERGFSGNIDLKTINWENYDLVVIDESHNFRNNPAVKDRVTRYQRLMNDVIKQGHKTKLLMLSATPVNNKMNDIKNQIAFITEDKDNALEEIGISSINHTLRNAQTIFNQWSKLDDNIRTGEKFVDMMDLDYFKLLDTLTIARSRKHIEKYYDLAEIGEFPNRLNPINESSDIDIKKEFPTLNEINSEIERLNLSVFSPFLYILPQKREDYARKYDIEIGEGKSIFKQTDREKSLIQLMRINLLKRMESSIHSFKLTIEKLLFKINKTLEKIDNISEYNEDIDISLIDPEEDEYDELMFGKKTKVLLQDMDLIKWKQDLELDKEKLEFLFTQAKQVDYIRDEKLSDLKKVISNKIENPINDDNNKILIFTAFADTAKYLYENISQWTFDNYGLYTALVTGSGDNKTNLKTVKNTNIDEILTSFSPISKNRNIINPEMAEEIDILIGTDCISEGQNLQDCDYLINYDIHWNPVRIIQRFGRIDRIGSKNKDIQLVNFWPNMELDEYIDLKGRVENRMVMVDVSATGEENIIANTNKVMNDLEYRKNQLEKLQDQVIDLEDISDAISITDLTFNDFKIELMEYMKEHKKELANSPSGIYSIVPAEEFEPGVIFLLRQVKGVKESKDKNALTPYYLVYITEDEEVKLNYIQSKKILDCYQKLCSGKKDVFKNLVESFDMETDNGKQMDKYSQLLKESIENIIGKKQETGVKSLFTKGGTSPVKNNIDGLEEFELITFLILK